MTTEAELLSIRSEVKRPDDFDAFWDATLAELASIQPEWERADEPGLAAPGHDIFTLRMESLGGSPIYGWLAVPKGAQGPLPGYLWLPGYSLGNPPPGPESLYDGVVTLGLNVHGNQPDTPYIHPSVQGREYITTGIGSPWTYIYRNIAAHCIRAFEVLSLQPEVDPGRVLAGGMSQGGGLALIVASLLGERVRLCFADMPWLCDLDRALSLIDRERYRRQQRVPDGRYYIQEYAETHPDQAQAVFRTYRYFDPLSHASRIVTPTQMSAGGRDPSCRPPTIYGVFNELNCVKEIQYLPTTGHEIVPKMWEAHANWLHSRLQ